MIVRLTKKQEQQLKDFYQHCLKIGLNTDRIDKAKAELYLTKIYKEFLNLDKPYFWHCDSPLMAQLVINI